MGTVRLKKRRSRSLPSTLELKEEPIARVLVDASLQSNQPSQGDGGRRSEDRRSSCERAGVAKIFSKRCKLK
ncbi:hypothetical protein [Oxynema aestuarii]|uniref:Uncharacterized protein n=1 Tax=Oxynema aestuarii AP17 TaxID=2064643 RepID=A0A6H1TV17_9CYAN|nr:hypothetical protein [Oxynema aestuarii]QIZ69603.1 hypothetical protein HCG48_02550 [Oxynema aestuarii AP17]